LQRCKTVISFKINKTLVQLKTVPRRALQIADFDSQFILSAAHLENKHIYLHHANSQHEDYLNDLPYLVRSTTLYRFS
jgi:hypothetical protein